MTIANKQSFDKKITNQALTEQLKPAVLEMYEFELRQNDKINSNFRTFSPSKLQSI